MADEIMQGLSGDGISLQLNASVIIEWFVWKKGSKNHSDQHITEKTGDFSWRRTTNRKIYPNFPK